MSTESCSGWQPRSHKKHTPSFSNSEIFRRLHACKHFIFVFWEAGNVSKDAGQNCCCTLACPFRRPQRHHHLVSLEPIKTSNEIPACVTRKIATLTRSWAVTARRRRSLCVPVNRSPSLLKKWGKDWRNSFVLRAILGRFYFFETVFSLKTHTAETQPVWLFVWVSWQGRLPGSLWRFFLTVFLGTFYFPVFSIPRFIVERGFTPAQFQNTPSCVYELLFFSFAFPRFLQDSNTDWDERIKNGSISGKKLRIWNFQYGKKNRFQYGFNCFSPHCQGSIDWGLRFEYWIEMKIKETRLRLEGVSNEVGGTWGCRLVCCLFNQELQFFLPPGHKKQKKKKKEPVFGVVSSFI